MQSSPARATSLGAPPLSPSTKERLFIRLYESQGLSSPTFCKETRELLEEVTDTSDKLHLTVKDFVRDEQEAQALGITRIPAFILQGHARGAVRYFGIPAGYEFSTLVEDLIDVSKGTTKLSEKTRQALTTVDQDLHIQVFVTPT